MVVKNQGGRSEIVGKEPRKKKRIYHSEKYTTFMKTKYKPLSLPNVLVAHYRSLLLVISKKPSISDQRTKSFKRYYKVIPSA